jgi:SAM-dependent methyltransferase
VPGRAEPRSHRDDAATSPYRHVLFFGLVRPYKGVDVLLRALAQVPDVSATIAGEVWGGVEPLQRLVAELGLADRVTLRPGYVPTGEIADLFQAADALVLPYRSGTGSANVLVAHAYGVPVVATSLPAFVERVREGVDGLLCRPDDVADLARALRDLYVPGRLAELRAGIPLVDDAEEWSAYVATLTGRGSGETIDPQAEGTPIVQVAAPPGGRVLAVAKRAAEQGMWTRVAAQVALERRMSWSRQIPDIVPPTAVLSTREEFEQAAREARRLRLPLHHDRRKNWDALGAVGAVLRECGRNATVLDAGSARYSSVLPWLRLYGLTDLTGINLEFGDEVRRGSVRFRHGDVTDTGFETGSFDAITCMSVIEHGVPVKEFLTESARLLRPGGILSVSTDYDQSPPDTTGGTAYGVPVHIFGPDEIRGMVETAAGQGLALVGDLQLEHRERPVHWKRTGLDYTFILLSFRRE